ncbi:hypothetical protein OROHE_013672 [Orobanche hederae]
MFCVSNATTRILWNGEPLNPIAHSRGLRQGCPLSPYLFVLCMEGLSYMVQDGVNSKKWSPIQTCRNGPSISHLLFADDLLLLGKATKKNARFIKDVLDKFCCASGLSISLPKSKVWFSNVGGNAIKREICNTLGIGQTTNLGRYLGINLNHSRVKNSDYQQLIDCVISRLSGWKSKTLSLAGRSTLIQSITLALPTYTMSTQQLPAGICDKLDKVNRCFLWSTDLSPRKIHLVNWSKVTEPKVQGGLGIRVSRMANLSLLMKLGWRILSGEDNIWSSLLRAKYLRNTHILSYRCKPSDSRLWRSLVRNASFLITNSTWNIGNGRWISFWFDNWCGTAPLADAILHDIHPVDASLRLADVFSNSDGWDFSKTHTHIPASLRHTLEDLQISLTTTDDSIRWNKSPSGIFTSKSAYSLLYDELHVSTNSNQNWLVMEGQDVPKTQVFHLARKNSCFWTLSPTRWFKSKMLCNDLSSAFGAISSLAVTSTWKPPAPGWVKLNTDGGTSQTKQISFIGGVCRDADGGWLWGYSKRVEFCDPAMAEAKGLLAGLEFAWERRIPRLEVESD